MKSRRLVALPLLSPLLAVLLVAALNPGPRVSFRLLTWETPKAPLGLWLAAAALGGAALSGVGTALALRQGAGIRERRLLNSRVTEPWSEPASRSGAWRSVADRARGPVEEREANSRGEERVSVPPPRSPGDPAPTVVVPFRVLRRPMAPPEEEPAAASVAWTQPTRARTPESVPVAATDDWGDAAASDDW
jgi:uncharacterized integral membrane protein